jgi:hypothetical protein
VAYLVKMLEKIVVESVPFLLFFFCLIGLFGLVMNSLDVIFNDPAKGNPLGDYENFTEFRALSYLLFTLRQSLGDFSVDTFKLLPKVIHWAAWFMWITMVTINSMIFLNFLIAVISDVFDELKSSTVEESYQKKCQTLVELEKCFKYCYTLRENDILVTRHNDMSADREEFSRPEIRKLNMKIASNHIETRKSINLIKDTLQSQQIEMHFELSEIKNLI